MKPWFKNRQIDTAQSQAYSIVCPIVSSISDHGTWTNLPAFISKNIKFGWDPTNNTVSILNMPAILAYNPKTDPTDFSVLFNKESSPQEKELLTAMIDRKNPEEAKVLQELAQRSFIHRVIRRVRLLETHTFAYPDPAKYNILVHVKQASVITDNDEGILWAKEDVTKSKIRYSINDFLGE